MCWCWSRSSLLCYSLPIGSSLPPSLHWCHFQLPFCPHCSFCQGRSPPLCVANGRSAVGALRCSKWAPVSWRGWLGVTTLLHFFLSFQVSDWLHLQGKINICTPIITSNLRALISSMFRQRVNLHRCRPTVCLLQAWQRWDISIWKSPI